MWKQKGNTDGEVLVYLVVFILLCVIWYITIPVLIIASLAWLYSEGWKKTVKWICILIIVVPLCGFGIAISLEQGPRFWKDYQYKRTPEGIISEKEKSIQTMKQDLERQLANIVQVRIKYQDDIDGFLREIGEEKQKYNISSVTFATERVRYNVKLIQERDASLSKLADIEKVTKNGHEEAVYMLRQLDGAKDMAKVMVEGSSLANNAEVILQKYSSYTGAVALNPRELTFKSPEVIWQQYVK